MSRILLTGAAGFLGRHVLERLRARGLPVRAVVRTEAGQDRLAALSVKPARGEEVVIADLTRRFAVPRLLEGCDQVIHVAGKVSSHRSDRKALYQDNVVAGAHVLEAALAANVKRFVYVSHVFALGAGVGLNPADESVTYNLSEFPSDFAQAARVGELEALHTWTRGLPIIFATPTFCLGPEDGHRSAAFFLELLLSGLPASPVGGLNIVDVRDAAEGIVAALEKGRIGERYLLGGTNVSFPALQQELAPLLARRPPVLPLPNPLARAIGELSEHLGGPLPLDRARAALYGRHWYYDSSRAVSALGWKPRPLEETIRETVAWLKEQGEPLTGQTVWQGLRKGLRLGVA